MSGLNTLNFFWPPLMNQCFRVLAGNFRKNFKNHIDKAPGTVIIIHTEIWVGYVMYPIKFNIQIMTMNESV